LAIDADSLRFRPGKGQTPDSEAWTFASGLAEVSVIDVLERTLQGPPLAVYHRGLRIRTVEGSEATIYLSGLRQDHLGEVISQLRAL